MSDWKLTPENLKNIEFALSLISSVINESSPKEPDFEPDWEFIFRFTKSHNVDNTIFYAIEQLNNKPEPALLKKWMDIRNKCIHRNMIQREEFEAICSAFEENKIEYMPVKGFDVSRLYPAEDIRYMSDLDILIKDNRDKATEILLEKGYTLKKGGVDYDQPLTKMPFMVVELHNNLFPKYSPYRSHFENIFSKCEKNGCRYNMSGEDFYIYETVHLYKHYAGSGSGIRSIMDFYFINKKLKPKFNENIISEKLKLLELNEFSNQITDLADKWFEKNDFKNFSDEELYILSSGTYGTIEHMIKNRREKNSRLGYYFSRLFPSKSIMFERYPALNKRPFLLPLYYVYRPLNGIVFKNKKIIKEFKIISNNKKTKT